MDTYWRGHGTRIPCRPKLVYMNICNRACLHPRVALVWLAAMAALTWGRVNASDKYADLGSLAMVAVEPGAAHTLNAGTIEGGLEGALGKVLDGTLDGTLEGTLESARLKHQTLVHNLMLVKQALVQAQAAVDTSALKVEMHRMQCEMRQAVKFWWESADQC